MSSNKCKWIKNDIILIGVFIVIAIVFSLYLYIDPSSENELYLQIVVDGQVSHTYDFDNDTAREIILEEGNTVMIEDGAVYMVSATCPDGLCVKQGKITMSGQSIICLPHKVVVRLVGYRDTDGLDVMPR